MRCVQLGVTNETTYTTDLDDGEELPSLACLDLLDLEVDVAGLVLGCGGLKLEVQGHHRSILRGGRRGLVLRGLCLRAQCIELTGRK